MPSIRSAPPMGLFPTNGLLPKETTQALAFLKKYPEYDGSGVRVAILDTGVDPAAIGLDGKGKMVDVIDCTGSGDIALVEVSPSSSSSTLGSKAIELVSPVTGRKILVLSSLKNPTGTWLVGAQAAYKLWPGDLISRRKAERRAAFDVEHSKLFNQVQTKLTNLDKPAASTNKDVDASKEEQGEDKNKTKIAQEKEELKIQLATLKEMSSSYSDPGPIIEAVVFHDGKHYRVVVGGAEGDTHDPSQGAPSSDLELLKDTSLDLTSAPALADFRFEKQHAEFGKTDMLTYSVNVLTDDVDIEAAYNAPTGKAVALSLVVTSGSHATHVAGIVGAHRTDDQVKNGVSKGCEIVSMKIGDTRRGSMETQQALLRAAQALIAAKVSSLSRLLEL